jgi:hypothetical protein
MEIFLVSARKNLDFANFFSAPGQNKCDERDYSVFGRGCVMRDCQIERNVTVLLGVNEVKFCA